MNTHIIILYFVCASLILWQFSCLKQEQKVIKTIQELSDKIKKLEKLKKSEKLRKASNDLI